jgi:hypothetical protein
VLEGLVLRVVAGMARDLTAQTQALHLAVTKLDDSPGAAARDEARRRFASAVRAWKRAQAFRSGPFVTSQAFPRATFWPARAEAVDAALAAPVLDEQLVEGLTVDARGLWALEYLLFAPRFEGSIGDAKVRRYARELSANVLGYARRASRELGDARAFARVFARSTSQSVAALGAQSVDTLEFVRGKLERATRMPPQLALEGYYSRTSTDVAAALLEGTESIYLGGLEELAERVDPRVPPRVRAAFSRLHGCFRALGPELDVAARTRPEAFRAATRALAELKHVYDIELRSVLDV